MLGLAGERAPLLEPPAPHLCVELAARGTAISEADAAAALRAEIGFYRAHHDEAVDGAAASVTVS